MDAKETRPSPSPDTAEAMMAQRHKRRRHVLNLWGRKSRRERILEEAERQQQAERLDAQRRILEEATRYIPMIPERRTPLLTRGQAAYSSHDEP